MDYQEQILAFLQKPENLPFALEVAKHVEALRPRLHEAFWKEMHQAFEARLEKSAFAGRWEITDWLDFNKAYCNFGIQAKFLANAFEGSLLKVVFMQESPPNYQLRYGLCWSKLRTAPDRDAFRNLLMRSRSASVPAPTRDVWWPACSPLNISPRSDEFMQQYGLQPAEFVDGLVEKIWDYFIALEPTLYQVNQELVQGK